MSTFWDFSAERFLAIFNADVENENGDMRKLGLGPMSKEELEDMLWHVASTSPFLTWAPEGIIRRLPLTTPEFMEIRGGAATWDDVVFPKGRNLIDWDWRSETLLGWDNTKMETDLEVLEDDNGITYTDGRVVSFFDYQVKLRIKEKENGPPPTEEELEFMAEEKKTIELLDSVDAYNKKFPDAKDKEVFDNSFWPIWTVDNPEKSAEEGFEEYKEIFSTTGKKVSTEDVLNALASSEKCDPQ